MINLHRLLKFLLLAAAVLSAPAWAADDTLKSERQRYQEAQRALRAGNITQFRVLLASLSGYPLYPVLLQDYLRPRLASAESRGVADFLRKHADLPAAAEMRAEFLRVLAQRQEWQTLLEVYTPQADIAMRCYQLLARLKLGRTDYLLEDARTVWLSGDSQPDQCDPVFARLDASGLLTPETVWQRIGLAMEKGNTSLAQWLGRRLPGSDQDWVTRWLDLHRNPARISGAGAWPDTAVTRAIALHAVRHLARQDIGKAWSAWRDLRARHQFTPGDAGTVEYELTLRAAQTRHPLARELLAQIDNERVDEKLFHERVVLALRDRDWATLLKWTEGIPPAPDAVRGPWLYWRGGALEQSGRADEAREFFERAAQQRDFYGFSAHDRLGRPYALNHNPLPEDPDARLAVLRTPGVQRAHEYFALGQHSAARREWTHVLGSMTSYQMQMAATLAHSWGWYDRALLTLNKAESWDDLVVRFPLAYREGIEKHAAQRGLDLAWVFSVVRQESAFIEDARSPAGALGLMQVMPATGKETARALGMKNFTATQLTHPSTNLPIGTAYLKRMLSYFDDNMVLATAAYNAGPGNVSRWLRAGRCTEPDEWIEQIPFEETRKYVQRILYFASIYDWRLGRDVRPIAGRVAPVMPRGEALAAALTCTGATTAAAG